MNATADKTVSESKLELFSLLADGYNDIKEGKVKPLDEVEEKIRQRRANRGNNPVD